MNPTIVERAAELANKGERISDAELTRLMLVDSTESVPAELVAKYMASLPAGAHQRMSGPHIFRRIIADGFRPQEG